MPTLSINGQTLTVPAGTPVLEACLKLGIEIPRFCYHPRLPVVGNCRMCQVEIEKQPKLAVSCATPAADGMVVHTHSERAVAARRAVLEFLLLNHPLDCPICDRGGECPLQDFTMRHGPGESRSREPKVHRIKHRRIGHHVVFDAERCILCTRCVRFTHHVSGTGELGVFGRGDRNEIALFPGRTLDNPYSGNVIDICPVGALTSLDYRFKSRPWDLLRRVDTVCGLCSMGCNVTLDVRPLTKGSEVLRIRPRENDAVNACWMCDQGRFGFTFIHDPARLGEPRVRREGGLRPAAWEDALAALAEGLRGVVGRHGPQAVGAIASSRMTNEEAAAFARFTREVLGSPHMDFRLCAEQAEGGDRPLDGERLLRRADQTPNTRGLRDQGLVAGPEGLDVAGMLRAAAAGRLKALLVVEADLATAPLDGVPVREALGALEFLAVWDLFETETGRAAHVLLPALSYAEKEGTFTNWQGRVQRVVKGLEPPGVARPLPWVLSQVASRLGAAPLPEGPGDLWADLARRVPAYAGIAWEDIGPQGVPAGAAAAGAAH
jgi:NADH-quinone oxidoreductase subunit G